MFTPELDIAARRSPLSTRRWSSSRNRAYGATRRIWRRSARYLAYQYRIDNRLDAALAMSQRACREQQALSRPTLRVRPRNDTTWHDFTANLGVLERDMGRFTASDAAYEQAHQKLEPLAAEFPDNLDLQVDLANVYRRYWHDSDIERAHASG